MTDLEQVGDRFTAVVDGEELEVFNHVSVAQRHYVNSVNGYETFDAEIARGDMGSGPEPEAVTDRVARILHDEFRIDVEDRDIQVVDPTDEEVGIR